MKTIDIKNLKPGDEIELDMIVQASPHGYVMAYDWLYEGHVEIARVKLTAIVPEDFNAVNKSIEAIDKQMGTIKDEANKKLMPLQAMKNQLMQVTYAGQEILDPEKPA